MYSFGVFFKDDTRYRWGFKWRQALFSATWHKVGLYIGSSAFQLSQRMLYRKFINEVRKIIEYIIDTRTWFMAVSWYWLYPIILRMEILGRSQCKIHYPIGLQVSNPGFITVFMIKRGKKQHLFIFVLHYSND